jgi:methyl-accepting chemotaxis protein
MLVGITGIVRYASVDVVDAEANKIAEDGQKRDAAAEMVIAIG